MSRIGPYIKFDGKLWVHIHGQFLPTRGKRLQLVNPKTGLPRKTEKEVKFTKPGTLTVYESRRRQPAYKYEDAGYYTPPVTDKMVRDDLREATEHLQAAKRVKAALDAAGLGIEAAYGYAGAVAQDMNHRAVYKLFGNPEPDGITPSPQDVSSDLGWGGSDYFAYFLMGLYRDKASQSEVLEVIKADWQDSRLEELKRNFWQVMTGRQTSLRSSVVRLACENEALRPRLLGLLV